MGMIMYVERAKITVKELLAAGYKNITDPFKTDLGAFYLGSYQKAFDDAEGIKYHIVFAHTHLQSHSHDVESMQADTQFRRGDTVFNVHMLNQRETLAQVEAFFEEMWRTMKVDHYQKR